MTDDYTPLTDNSVEARLRDIEAVVDRWGSSAVDEAIVTPDVRYLVALVRRYRLALERIAGATAVVTGSGVVGNDVTWEHHVHYPIDPKAIARETLNEEELEMTTEHADWPADWNDYDIKREIASMTEARLTNTLVHLRFVCQKWRSAREGKMDLLKAYESTFHRQILTGESEAVVRRWLDARHETTDAAP